MSESVLFSDNVELGDFVLKLNKDENVTRRHVEKILGDAAIYSTVSVLKRLLDEASRRGISIDMNLILDTAAIGGNMSVAKWVMINFPDSVRYSLRAT